MQALAVGREHRHEQAHAHARHSVYPLSPWASTAAQCDRHSRSPQLKMISLSDVLSVVEGTTRASPDALPDWPTPTLQTPPCQSGMPLTLPHSTCLARLAIPQHSCVIAAGKRMQHRLIMQLTAGAYPNAGYCHRTTTVRWRINHRLITPGSASATYANAHWPLQLAHVSVSSCLASPTHYLQAPPRRSNSL